MNKIPMTARGAEQLREELHRLKSVERAQVIAAIAEARAHGDKRKCGISCCQRTTKLLLNLALIT